MSPEDWHSGNGDWAESLSLQPLKWPEYLISLKNIPAYLFKREDHGNKDNDYKGMIGC